MAIIIPIKDDPNHSFPIQLDNKIFTFYFLYNSKNNYWSLSISDEDEKTLISGVKIVENYPLMFYHKKIQPFTGDLYCKTLNTKTFINRNSFKLNQAKLLYLSEAELLTV